MTLSAAVDGGIQRRWRLAEAARALRADAEGRHLHFAGFAGL